MTSGWAWGRGRVGGQADTHQPVSLQLTLNLPPVVFIVVHLVVACDVDIQQDPVVGCGFELFLDCGEETRTGVGLLKDPRMSLDPPLSRPQQEQPPAMWQQQQQLARKPLGRCQGGQEKGCRAGCPAHLCLWLTGDLRPAICHVPTSVSGLPPMARMCPG